MVRDASRPPTWTPSRRAWLHFAVLVVLAGALEVFTLHSAGDLSGSSLKAFLPGYYYGVLPVIAAVSVGMLAFDSSVTRQALILAAVTTVVMVGLDLIPPTLTLTEAQQVVFQGDSFRRQSIASELHGGNAFRTLLSLVRGDLASAGEKLTQYPPDHPRLLVAMALSAGGYVTLPAILMGVVLGVQAWVARNVTFRRPVDERVARVMIAWVLAPFGFYLVTTWLRRIHVQVLFGSSGLAAMLVPYVVLGLIAAVGWVTAWRASRWIST